MENRETGIVAKGTVTILVKNAPSGDVLSALLLGDGLLQPVTFHTGC